MEPEDSRFAVVVEGSHRMVVAKAVLGLGSGAAETVGVGCNSAEDLRQGSQTEERHTVEVLEEGQGKNSVVVAG